MFTCADKEVSSEALVGFGGDKMIEPHKSLREGLCLGVLKTCKEYLEYCTEVGLYILTNRVSTIISG